ncbi:TetR/AcrR family transcriptional regulator [Nocardia lijiangensis]|uniref:TetR/AcrR family transcriptional regulator n=1 Tax=Nocardia lijiangensis TaxID=299618 RepID=UPI00082EEC1A|nr:TetR/AcrR family transcriptional regulator [Nocardia lijiangensis]
MAERRKGAYAPRMAPEQRREQLLDAVLRVIVEQGIHKVSIDTVAKEAGVSRPVIYGLFEDSDHLLRASLDREETAALAQMAEAVPLASAGDPIQAMADSLENFLAAVQAAPDRWRAVFLIADASTPAFRRRIERGRQAFIAALASFVRAALPPERLSTVDVELTARTMYALFWEAGRLVLADPETFPPQRIRDYANGLIPGLPAFRDPNPSTDRSASPGPAGV